MFVYPLHSYPTIAHNEFAVVQQSPLIAHNTFHVNPGVTSIINSVCNQWLISGIVHNYVSCLRYQ